MKRTSEKVKEESAELNLIINGNSEIAHIRYLDGLRGLAALVVVVHHFLIAFYPAMHTGNGAETHFGIHQSHFIEAYFARTPLNVLYGGDFAVCIFFVLSGFVLSYKYFHSYNRETVISYAVKRYMRLFIPVFFSIILVFIMIKLSLFFNVEAAVLTKSYWWLKVLWGIDPTFKEMLHAAFIDVFLFNNNSYNTALWTMTFELLGSFLVFSFILMISEIRKRYIFYLLTFYVFYELHQNYYLAFIGGVALCDIFNNYKKLHLLNKPLPAVSLLVFGLFFGSYPPVEVDGTMFEFLKVLGVYDPYSFFHVIGAFFIVLVFISFGTIQKLFSMKPFLFLGKISFSMYLLHALVLGSLSCFLFIKLNAYISYHMSFLISFMISLGVLIISSLLMSKYVDEYALRVSQKIYSRYFKLTKQA
jgi:peptidoglycan/LPS O-acetylase OafA/YrhL